MESFKKDPPPSKVEQILMQLFNLYSALLFNELSIHRKYCADHINTQSLWTYVNARDT